MLKLRAAPLCLALAGFIACSSSDDDSGGSKPQAQGGECGTILEACHLKDDGSQDIAKDCHDLSHTLDDDQCVVRLKECVDACEALPCPTGVNCSVGHDGGTGGAGGTGHEAGTGGHSGGTTDGGGTDSGGGQDAGTACADYCGCLTTTCGGMSGYPHASEGDCLKACAGFSAKELSCFSKWCKTAQGAPGVHNCQHAWGQLNLAEC